jgi:16S rRNA (cytidine1402-2'-O)-methyltransferase
MVVPLTGPSSIFLTLMASGLNGQNFAFIGYLPVKSDERKKRIKQIELRSKQEKQTQIFIEAPYRNNHVFEDILKECNTETSLTLGVELTTSSEFIATKKIRDWKNSSPPDINKKNCVFCLLA